MKRNIKFSFLIILISSITTVNAFALAEKEKRITRSFNVNQNTLIEVDNQFGKIHINTWDKNQVEVDILIKVNKNNDADAERLLDQIDVEIDESPDVLGFRTRVGKVNNTKGESFEINYTMNIPKRNRLDVSNNFGDFYLADFAGPLELKLSYGNLKIDQLSNNAEIELSFGAGSSNIQSMNNGEVTAKYSNLNIGNAGNLELNNQFSKVELKKVQNIEVECKYGNLKIDEADRIEGEIGFSGFQLGSLKESMDVDLSYGKNMVLNQISSNISEIIIDSQFTSFELTLPENISARFEADFQFGNLNVDEDKINFTSVEKDFNSKKFTGIIGNKSNAHALCTVYLCFVVKSCSPNTLSISSCVVS